MKGQLAVNVLAFNLASATSSIEKKVKQSHYRSGEALRFPEVLGSQISKQSTHEGGKVVRPTHRPPLPSRETLLVLISVKG